MLSGLVQDCLYSGSWGRLRSGQLRKQTQRMEADLTSFTDTTLSEGTGERRESVSELSVTMGQTEME